MMTFREGGPHDRHPHGLVGDHEVRAEFPRQLTGAAPDRRAVLGRAVPSSSAAMTRSVPPRITVVANECPRVR